MLQQEVGPETVPLAQATMMVSLRVRQITAFTVVPCSAGPGKSKADRFLFRSEYEGNLGYRPTGFIHLLSKYMKFCTRCDSQ